MVFRISQSVCNVLLTLVCSRFYRINCDLFPKPRQLIKINGYLLLKCEYIIFWRLYAKKYAYDITRIRTLMFSVYSRHDSVVVSIMTITLYCYYRYFAVSV